MALQQLDLGAVYDTLMRKQSVDLQAQQVGQQGQMNALQMARYQREGAEQDRVQSELSKLNDPNLDEAGKRSALGRAYPEYLARQAFRETDFKIAPDGTVINGNTGEIVSRPQILDGDPPQVSAPRTAPQTAPPSAPPPRTAQANAPPVPLTPTSGSGPMPPRSNNVGNIRTNAANAWQGKVTPEGEAFEHFDTAENGVRALSLNLGSYAKRGINTLRGIVSTWAPPNENQTDALITNAAKRAGFDPDQPLDMNDPTVREKVTRAIILQEQGKIDLGDDVIKSGVRASLGLGAQPQDTKATSQVDQHVIQVLGPELANKVFTAEKANPNALLTDVMPTEWVQQHPEAKGVTIAQRRQEIESRFTSATQQEPQQSGDEGFSRVRNLKAAGIAQDAPPGMQWVGRRRPDGSLETKVAPMPGAPDDRASKQATETFDQETKLRAEHQKLVGGFEIAQTNYATMPELAADDTGGSDIALVNAFFKTFAPLSNVQEGEFSQAAKTAGVSDRVINLLDRALTGQVLTPTQRQEMITAAGRFYKQQKTAVEGANEKYTKLSQSYPGVNADRVVINPIRDLPKYEPRPKTETKAEPKAETRADMPNAKKAADGKWYVADPARPGKYLEVQ